MSRFFRGGSSSSESEDEKDEIDSKWLKKAGDSDSDESEDEGRSEKESSIPSQPPDWSSDESEKEEEVESEKEESRKSRWLVKDEEGEQDDDRKKKKKEKKKGQDGAPVERIVRKKKEKNLDEPPVEKKEVELTPDMVDKTLAEIVAQRGKKGFDHEKQLDFLKKIFDLALTVTKKLEIRLFHISFLFETAALNPDKVVSASMWREILTLVTEGIDLLMKDPTVHLVQSDSSLTKEPEPGHSFVVGDMFVFLERLDDELLKGFQSTDVHTQEYVDRLRDESSIVELAIRVQEFYASIGRTSTAALAAERRVEHIYFMPDGTQKEGTERTEALSSVVENLCFFILENGDDRSKTRALICLVYNKAVNGNFFGARDLLLMSHLGDTIFSADMSTQVLYNRTLARLGLTAFRLGLITEAHNAVSDICGTGRVKELLAQGMTYKYPDRTVEQEKQEQKRQVPFHLHLNPDMLECCHLVSAMLLEVPNIAQNPFETRKKVVSRSFRRLIDQYDRQNFTGPPENLRDCVVAASRALLEGNWKIGAKYILQMKVWNYFTDSEEVKVMLRRKIQDAALRTYMFVNAPYFESISVDSLATFFELTQNDVRSALSKMMFHEELLATWHQPSGSVMLHKIQSNRLQFLSMQFAEKASMMTDNDTHRQQKVQDQRQGGGDRYDRQDSWGSRGGDRSGGGRYSSRGSGGPSRGRFGRETGGDRGYGQRSSGRDHYGGGGGSGWSGRRGGSQRRQ